MTNYSNRKYNLESKIFFSFFRILNQSSPQIGHKIEKKLNLESSNKDFLIIFDFLKDFGQENEIYFSFYHKQ